MAYGVPYAFVPGTKAKADEVNANFNDVLSKIEDTNTRIDEVNTSLSEVDTKIQSTKEELDEQKLNLDLSNISSAGQKLFDAKANASLLDGTWAVKYYKVADSTSISLNTTKTYSLSSYLPKDSSKYEVRCSFWLSGGSSYGDAAQINLYTDLISSYTPVGYIVTRENAAYYNASNAFLLVGKDRQVKVMRTSFGSGSAKFTLHFDAYRKVR